MDGDNYQIRLKLSIDQERLIWKSEKFNYQVEEQVSINLFIFILVMNSISNFFFFSSQF